DALQAVQRVAVDERVVVPAPLVEALDLVDAEEAAVDLEHTVLAGGRRDRGEHERDERERRDAGRPAPETGALPHARPQRAGEEEDHRALAPAAEAGGGHHPPPAPAAAPAPPPPPPHPR